MQKLIIIDKNISYIHTIFTNISKTINNIKLYNFYLNDNENLRNLIYNKEIDIIIINAENIGIDIIEFIDKNNIEIYNKSIILLYDNILTIKKLLKHDYEKYIFKCVKISNNIEYLLNILLKITFIKENNFEEIVITNTIERNLRKIGYDLNDIGTKYLVDGIKYLYKNDIKEFKLNNIYLMLSKKYNKSLNTIQGDITTATKKMRKHCNKKVILEYFNYLELIKMPTIKEIISVVNENI